jgi:hypothetical protein
VSVMLVLVSGFWLGLISEVSFWRIPAFSKSAVASRRASSGQRC